jgi:hypothetical protein
MNRSPCDTSTEAEEVQMALLREAPPSRRLALTFSLNRSLRALVLAQLKAAKPSASPEELRRALADRWLGIDLANKVYGPAPNP